MGVFEYTDHYTVFHYGRMPDQIPGKGEAICRMAHFNFLLLEDAGVATHFRRLLPPLPTRTGSSSPSRAPWSPQPRPPVRHRPVTVCSPFRSSSATSSPPKAPSTGAWPPES
ncbi:phosphoribosylaminoimidazolesuccinocarboxamide synthase [Streptomyces anulatus]|uniref:phosphoribosylaminoimidazolesuccinocarboxamide synthase n=1 Tax=Streptomyces anulatus TaxID=1892 RepID=UPI002B1CE012|nr:phosphoribosylaminoimidazolesuccinocarboxamide synthase [Streptomyces anulatus]